MRSLRTTLILSCAVLALVPLASEPADARPRVGVVLGIAAGAALGLMGARRLHAARHHHARHYAARPRGRQVAHNRARSSGDEAAEAAQTPAAQAARPSRAMAARMAGGHVGWAGPVFWPYAYDDMFNYAFDRKSERGQFWSYGQGDILATVMPGANPQAALAASAGNMRLDSTRGSNRGGDTADSCLSASESNWTIDWIKQTVQLKDSQKAKFDELANAFNAAAEALTSTCPTKTAEKTDAKPADTKAADAKSNATPEDRLEAMRLRLWSMRQAVTAVQGPLEDFYNSLDDAQKASLNAAMTPPPPRGRGRTKKTAQPQMDATAALCFGQDGDWPGKQLERALQPNKDQQATLETLKTTSTQMGQFLMTSCPQKPLPTPQARLGAIADRLLAMEYVVLSVSPALGAFTDSLNDEQKARLSGAPTQ